MHLLTGATGYIGGRLLRRLESNGPAVRCLCRNPEALSWRVAPGTELVRGDLLQPASLGAAFSGVDTAFYLVHSMQSGEEFEAEERSAASNFADAARRAGVRRIVYLGGLGHGEELSPHMRSRAKTGDILRSSGVPVIELQASIVIGSGSASFEMMRAISGMSTSCRCVRSRTCIAIAGSEGSVGHCLIRLTSCSFIYLRIRSEKAH